MKLARPKRFPWRSVAAMGLSAIVAVMFGSALFGLTHGSTRNANGEGGSANPSESLAFADGSENASPDGQELGSVPSPSPPAALLKAYDGVSTSTSATKPPGDSSSTTVSAATCENSWYQVAVPAGWFELSSNPVCTLFATVPARAERCDCTVGIGVTIYSEESASQTLEELKATSQTSVVASEVLDGRASRIEGTWLRNDTPGADPGQYAKRTIYIFDDGPGSIAVSANEFQDWGGTESYQNRVAAVEAIANSLELR